MSEVRKLQPEDILTGRANGVGGQELARKFGDMYFTRYAFEKYGGKSYLSFTEEEKETLKSYIQSVNLQTRYWVFSYCLVFLMDLKKYEAKPVTEADIDKAIMEFKAMFTPSDMAFIATESKRRVTGVTSRFGNEEQ